MSVKWLKLETSNLVGASTMRSNFDSMQKNYFKGDVPSLGDLDLNYGPLRISLEWLKLRVQIYHADRL